MTTHETDRITAACEKFSESTGSSAPNSSGSRCEQFGVKVEPFFERDADAAGPSTSSVCTRRIAESTLMGAHE